MTLLKYENFMNNDLIFKTIAFKITDELDARGFVTDIPDGSDGLVDKISQIIEETLRGNTNYTQIDEINEDGWSFDLPNQVS